MFYLGWHYSTALSSGARIFWGGFEFLIEFFSMRDFLRTFFAPWKRMNDEHPSVFEFQSFMESVVINTILRVVGMIMKTLVIALGLFVITGYVIVWIFIAGAWAILPAALAIMIVSAILSLFCSCVCDTF